MAERRNVEARAREAVFFVLFLCIWILAHVRNAEHYIPSYNAGASDRRETGLLLPSSSALSHAALGA